MVDIDVSLDTIDAAEWLALALVLVTGIIHVYAGAVEARPPVLLAGAGFLAAIALFVLDVRRRLLYVVGAVYTAVQVPLWYVVKAGEYTTLGYVDKAVQVVLVALLLWLWLRARTGDAREAGGPSGT